jgi:hypothetical protein
MLRTRATPTESAFRVTMATNGRATRVTRLPKIEIVAAAQTLLNAELRQSELSGSSSAGGKCSSWRGSAAMGARLCQRPP